MRACLYHLLQFLFFPQLQVLIVLFQFLLILFGCLFLHLLQFITDVLLPFCPIFLYVCRLSSYQTPPTLTTKRTKQKLTTHKNTVLQPLYRSTCVSRHYQLRTGGFCWCTVLLPVCLWLLNRFSPITVIQYQYQ